MYIFHDTNLTSRSLLQVMHNALDADLLKKDLEAKLQRLVEEDGGKCGGSM